MSGVTNPPLGLLGVLLVPQTPVHVPAAAVEEYGVVIIIITTRIITITVFIIAIMMRLLMKLLFRYHFTANIEFLSFAFILHRDKTS